MYLLGLSYIQGIVYPKNQIKKHSLHVFYIQNIRDF